MSFAKNVNRYFKYVLIGMVVLIAVSLVISGNVGQGQQEAEKTVARIFGSVSISNLEWNRATMKAGAWFRLKAVREIDDGADYNSMQIREHLFKFREGYGMLAWHEPFQPSQEDLKAAARELIILGYDAKAKQVRATDEEVDAIIRGYLSRAGIGDEDPERQADFSRRYFLASNADFRDTVRDSILIDKALSLDVGGCNIRYEEIFAEKLANSRSVRVLVAGIDGARLPGDIVAVTDDEIRTEFDRARESYKMGGKVQLEYLMASYDDFKSRIKEPTPDEIKKYYDEHKREFLKPLAKEEGHHEGDGHDHGPPKEEFKTQEEVQEEIIRKIKERLASNEAYNAIKTISSKDVAERWYKLLEEEKTKEPKDSKSVKDRALARTAALLAEVKDKYKAQGIELRNGITLPFEKESRDSFDSELGKPSKNDPLEWAFQGPVGEIAHQIYQSDKGVSLIRISNKVEGYASDLTSAIREKIRQDLMKDRVAGRAKKLATEIVSRIKANGSPEVERLKNRPDVVIQRSSYLSAATPDADSGLVPPSLAQQVKSKILRPTAPDPMALVKPTGIEAQTIDGDVVGGDRRDWAFIVVVEDSVQVSPEVKDEEFLRDVRRHEGEELARARGLQAAKLVSSAEWKDDPATGAGSSPAN